MLRQNLLQYDILLQAFDSHCKKSAHLKFEEPKPNRNSMIFFITERSKVQPCKRGCGQRREFLSVSACSIRVGVGYRIRIRRGRKTEVGIAAMNTHSLRNLISGKPIPVSLEVAKNHLFQYLRSSERYIIASAI